ncbi:DUF2303 family protein [Nocardioides terrisoli]|uniref:DUF2303 family protein n=1 Tax=Nocardioides terrisoli TaxID=3388267 RepID=UPI00287BB50F|nr:DUF2303 family protein [Nocardioides marmorisolisilvae]
MTSELLSTSGDAQAIIDTATRAAEPTIVGDNLALVVVPDQGRVEVVDIEAKLASYRDHPQRKRGSFTVHNAESFCDYLAKHGVSATEVWADTIGNKIVGVINAHGGTKAGNEVPAAAGWADHRVTYAVQHTPAWKAWVEHNGKLLDQATFAELIEDRAVDIVRPSAADMLELAQHFYASKGGAFESSKLLSSGESQLVYREEIDAKAGRAGRLDIPKDFDLALVPFEGADTYKVTARFRFRIVDAALRVGYRLQRPEDVLREAFEGVVGQVESTVTEPVFRGVSP